MIHVGASKHTHGRKSVEADHLDQTLNILQKLNRFRSFTVALVTGDRFEVDHPDALVVRDGVAVCIGAGGFPVLFDHEGVSQLSAI
jgi:hypothetical protein